MVYRKSTAGPPRNEAQLQSRIWKRVIAMSPSAWVFHPVGGPYQTPGIPDLLICMEGMFIGMEIKFPRPGESIEHARARATTQQRQQIRRINDAGGLAGVVTSEEEAIDMINRAYRKYASREKEKEHG